MRYVLGIDPGPIVGAVLLRLPTRSDRPGAWYAEVAQITPNGLWSLIAGWIETYEIVAFAAERFVIGRLTPRVNDPGASATARDVLAGLSLRAAGSGVRFIERSAAMVKPWAEDKRLAAAGLLDITKGMGHARDAARHALFSACRDFYARDPLAADAAQRAAFGEPVTA